MSQFFTIGEGAFALTLRLPHMGMPEIISFASPPTTDTPLNAIERSSRVNGMDEAVPNVVLLPVGGMGFFGWPAIKGHRAGTDFTLQFQDWRAETGSNSLRLKATDPVACIELELTLAAHAGGVIALSSKLTNNGEADYMLDRCMAGSVPIPAGPAEVSGFTGMWGREFQPFREALGEGIWLRQSRRGRTSHDCPPILFVEAGSVRFAATLGWSGNHQMVVDRLDDGRRLLHAGEVFEPGEMILAQGESYQSPVLYTALDETAFHAFVRKELISWPSGEMSPRPVTLNTWEGNYFDHKLDSLKEQATLAASIGIERFVLDDGWFGRRDDDTTSLGDWDIDPRKYPDGLKPLVDHVTELGMEFGIWFEPEMINPVSDLIKAHPDWVLQVKGRPLTLSRHQLVLDLTRPEVSDYLFEKMDHVLANHAIRYIKWDMNRDLTHVGGATGRARTSAQTRAVYALMDRIRAAHPSVEIESCASGGGRIDFGVLKHTHRVWTSDCTDALERLQIQKGASSLLPPEVMGAHVSASPNHQTGRRHTLSFRALVAMAYHFGVELNPLTLTEQERDELAHYISVHKRLRDVLHRKGMPFRAEPLDGRYMWGAADRSVIALFVAQGAQMVREHPEPLKLPPAVSSLGGRWRVARMHPEHPSFIRMSDGQKKLLSGEITFNLADLDRIGLPIPMLQPESALLLELEPVEGDPENG